MSETSETAEQQVSQIRGSLAHRRRGRKQQDKRTPSQISPIQDRQKRDEKYHSPKRRMATHSQEKLNQAISEYQSGALTLAAASEKYSIPLSTLHDKVKSKHKKPRGRPYALPEEMERDLAHVVLNFCERGSVMMLEELSNIATAYAQHREIEAFKASPNWRKGFISRWNLEKWSEGKRKVLGIHRRISAREEIIEEFIQKLFSLFREFLSALALDLGVAVAELTHEDIAPAIFGMDETSLSNRTPLKYEPGKIVKKSGQGSIQCLQSICQGQSTVCATLLEVFRADGSSPFHWLTTKQSLSDEHRLILERINPETQLSVITLESGRFNSELHRKVLAEIGKLRQNRPTFVIQDTPNMHKTDDSITTAIDENIFLLGLPTNSSWFLQQADDLPFMLNKSEHYKRIREYRIQFGKSPDLFHTIKIYFESRLKTITSDVITESFRRVGQYDRDLRGPDAHQIRRKAAMARVKCSGTESWDETSDISENNALQRQHLIQLTSKVDELLAQLEELKDTICTLRIAASSYSLELHDLISRKSELKQALNDATSAMEAAELAESTVEVTRRASIPQVEDPSIVESFNERNFTTEDLTYLQEQRDLLRIRIDNLTATLKESKNSPSGTILSSGSRSVSLPRILSSRKALLGEVKKKISDLNQQQDELAKQQRKCLGDCQNLRRANPKAVLCKHCNLGYCRKCSQKYSITTHESSCTLALPESISLPTVGLSDDLIQVSNKPSSSF